MFVDVITKVIAVGVLVPGRRVPLIGDHVWCALTRNAGAAFSWGDAYTVELAVLVGGIIAVLAWRSRHVVSTAAAIAVGLVLGGAAGNLAGIDIDHASKKLDPRELVTNHIPLAAAKI